MKFTNKQIATVLLASTSLFNSAVSSEQSTAISKTNIENLKPLAVKAQDAFFKNYSAEEIKKYFKEDYIQHNPHVPNGRAPIIGFLPSLKESNTTYTTHRLLQDGEFIIAHNTYHNAESFGSKEMIAFDIYRMEDGKVAEHWDVLTPKVSKDKTASGRSQTDGPTEIVDLEKTAENKTLINNFINDVLMGKNPEKITEYISTEQYDQHNPMIKDGLVGLNEAIEHLSSQNNMFKYNKIHKILGEGNFVISLSEGEWSNKPYAFYDLFRIKDGKIVEHWDITQEIPAKMAHTNGMF